MKTNGSVYVSVVLALLAAYFSYQWWFNPSRAIKRQLGELAATLSVPASGNNGLDRLSRAARFRTYFAEDVHIHLGPSGPDISSRDALVAAMGAWTPPPGGWSVELVDVQVTLDSESDARADMTVEITSRDPQTGQPALDSREARVGIGKRNGAWVITSAEQAETPQRP